MVYANMFSDAQYTTTWVTHGNCIQITVEPTYVR